MYMTGEALMQAQKIAAKVTSNLGGAGLFGVEMFIKGDEVIFSELSPRPHDTGMVTLISQNLSEFDLHARAVLGLPIPQLEVYGPSASHVVLANRHARQVAYEGIEEALKIPGVDIRVFGKPTARPYRRMAVCLARANTLEDARAKADSASKAVTIVYTD
jgi:phosphoribosylglycinamide formyltransferase 2